MSKHDVKGFDAQMAPFRSAVGEMLRLALQFPDGLQRVKAFQDAHRDSGFVEWEEAASGDGCALVALPSAALVSFIIELRGGSEGNKGSDV